MNNENSPPQVIAGGCSAGREYLWVLEKYLYKEVNKIESRTKDTQDILNIIDMIMWRCNKQLTG